METKQLIDDYSKLFLAIKDLQDQKDVLKSNVLTEEQVATINQIEEDFEGQLRPLIQELKRLEDNLKAITIAKGETQRGTMHMFTYSKPRVTWDSKGLEGYMVAHPEVKAFRKVGDPSVSVRKI